MDRPSRLRPNPMFWFARALMGAALGAAIQLSAAATWAAKGVTVFIVHSWTKGEHEGFVARMRTELGRPLAIHVEYLDIKRAAYTPEMLPLLEPVEPTESGKQCRRRAS